MSMVSTSMVVYAETIVFHITVGGSNTGVKCKRILKSDTSHVNDFYVTTISINPPGTAIYARSNRPDGTLSSDRVTINETNITYNASYNGNAPGRYTP